MNRIPFVPRRMRNALLAGGVALALFAGPAHAESTARQGGWGALAAFGTLLYSPVKMTYATLGLVFGGMAWGLSGGDSAVINGVITPAVRGDYVLLPSHLRGEDQLEFLGRAPGYEDPYNVAAEPPIMEESF